MRYVIAGLGNPGEEYTETRHNVGRMALEVFRKAHDFPLWEENKKLHALESEGRIGKEEIVLLEPETYMNKSGVSVKSLITSAQKAERLIVVHDDIDVPLGTLKITFGRGAGGHKGVESIIRALHTKNFIRVRVGITPATPSGKLKKPQGEEKVLSFILGSLKEAEREALKKSVRKAASALETIIRDGRQRAMNAFN
jgi:PTH1 family peptidyl-tRNA hydrolase